MKAKILRDLFKKNELIKVVGAHNGLTAKLIEKQGFHAVWASSLEVSGSHAVPDANILTMTDYLNAAINMNDSVSIPIIVDVDQGYGNSINVMRMVQKFEAAGIAGVVMEDKKFPKQNSLLNNGKQDLASIAEFVGKIMAAKNAQKTKEFMVMARVEALIAGWGQEEAMKRAKAYVDAGADAILIHSKKSTPDEIIEFVKNWDKDIPLIVVPTNYYLFTEEEIKKYPRIKMVIYANHVIRSTIKSVKGTLKEIYEQKGIHTVHPKIAPLKEIFDLQEMDKMKEQEEQFINKLVNISAIIPAAGKHHDIALQTLLKDTPLCMLDINGKSILQRNVESLKKVGIDKINVVVGYNSDKINLDGIKKIKTQNYETTGAVYSIMAAEKYMDNKTIIVYSDILFEEDILERLVKREEDIVLVIDSSYQENKKDNKTYYNKVRTKILPIQDIRVYRESKNNEILEIGSNVLEATHEFVGMILFSKKGIKLFKKCFNELVEKDRFETGELNDLIQYMINKGIKINCLEIHKGWTEVQTFEDYKRVSSQLKK